MFSTRRPLHPVVVAAAALIIAALVFTSAIFILAFIAPVVAAALAWGRCRIAWSLWQSRGRFEVGDAIQIIEPRRARLLALTELGSALATLIAGAVPATLLFVSLPWSVVVGVSAVLVFSGAGSARRRLLATSTPIEVLPPERHLDD